MGLDGVELVMEVEEAFNIKISDEQAQQMSTVGDMYNHIVDCKRDIVPERVTCLSAATFYLIRRTLCSTLDLNPKAVHPRATLESTLLRTNRRQFWKDLESALELKLPGLVCPSWLVALTGALSFAAAGWVGSWLYSWWGFTAAVISATGVLLTAFVLLTLIVTPFATRFSSQFTDYRGLAHTVLALNFMALSERFNSWNALEAWEALKVIVVEQLGVKPEEVTFDARFVADLDVG